MKKLFAIFVLVYIILGGCYAQTQSIYQVIYYFDKFDDVLKVDNRKTLITITDSTFVIEEKGKEPIIYYILDIVSSTGSQDNIVNLTGNVYGYQKTWCVISQNMLSKYYQSYENCIIDMSEANIEAMTKFWIFATVRTITTRYTGEYINEFFWLMDEINDDKLGKNVNRIVYMKK